MNLECKNINYMKKVLKLIKKTLIHNSWCLHNVPVSYLLHVTVTGVRITLISILQYCTHLDIMTLAHKITHSWSKDLASSLILSC